MGIGGSLCNEPDNLSALKIALDGAKKAGSQTQLFDLKTMNLPMYVHEMEQTPVAVKQLCDAVHESHGLIWCSPLYHGTISGVFKNALDWLELLHDKKPPYLTDKVVGLICTSGGTHGLQAINSMEFVVRALRGWTVPFVVPIDRASKIFDENGQCKEEKITKNLHMLGEEVVRAARHFC